MHPLVRKLYKEALFVGKDYPLGLDKVRKEWKKAIRNPNNCPSCYNFVRQREGDRSDKGRDGDLTSFEQGARTRVIPKKMHSKEHPNPECERELRKAVGKGRYMIREMIGVIQLKKYRSLKRRYGNENDDSIAIFHKSLSKHKHKQVGKFDISGDDRTRNQNEKNPGHIASK